MIRTLREGHVLRGATLQRTPCLFFYKVTLVDEYRTELLLGFLEPCERWIKS